MKRLITLSLVALTMVLFAGCGIDSDGDGEPDVSDPCPLDPNKTDPGECGCGIADGTCNNDTDSDNDGTPDQDDKCPLDPNKIQPGVCGCGVAEGTCSVDPIISASAENTDNGEAKEMAFDKDVNTKWLAFDDSAWIQYEFGGGASKVVKAYSITSANDYAERDPREWKLLGSDNGTNWITLDERSNECFKERFYRKDYMVHNNNAYKIYRLEIVSNKYPDSANSTQVAEIEFLESSNGGIEPGTEGDCNQNPGTGLRFAVYGDSRSNPDQHKAIVDQIAAFDPELVLHTGDIWDHYSSSEWKGHITRHDNLNRLLNNNLYLVARGNHEGISEVLNFRPSIVRDGKVVYSFLLGNVFFISLAMDPNDQRTFLTNQLKSQQAQEAIWKVVFAHYPIYSAGSHGGDGISAVESIMDQYGVDLYFCGHDHHYERTHQIKGKSVVDKGDNLMAGRGTVYIVTGGGGAPLYSVGSRWWTNTAESVRHYVEIIASDTNIAIKAVNNSGNKIDSFTISR